MNELSVSTDPDEGDLGALIGGNIHPLILRFSDPGLEAAFVRRLARQTVLLNRVWMVCAAVFLGLFGILEYFVLSEELTRAWLIRYLLIVPMALAVTLHTWHGAVGPFHEAVRISAVVLAHATTMFLLAATPPPGNIIYYLLSLLAIIYTQGYVFLRFSVAAVISWLAFAGYASVIYVVGFASVGDVLYQSIFLFFVTVTATFNHYHQEVYARREFRHNRILRVSLQRQEQLAQRAQEANDSKANFMAMMSHELRTPLNAIIGFSDIGIGHIFGPLGDDRYDEYLRHINTSGRHLLSVVNDILDVTKIEAGKFEIEGETVDLRALLQGAVGQVKNRAAVARLSLTCNIEDGMPMIAGSEVTLRQAILNLLSNAILFTPADGSVELSARHGDRGEVEIRISDTGVGMTVAEIELALKPFSQVDSSLGRRYEGTGLGLPLARRLVELHGGDLWIESEPGRGTDVIVRLPIDGGRRSGDQTAVSQSA